MASRNFHKRRTKERKQRQADERRAMAKLRHRASYAGPTFGTGMEMAAVAAALLGTPTLCRALRR